MQPLMSQLDRKERTMKTLGHRITATVVGIALGLALEAIKPITRSN